ncbi:MAG: heparinase II/III domain-containing protein, partial [Brevundimonas sp.]
HKHADDFSFELFDKGRYWVIDSGRYTYSNSPVKNYMRSAAAHNSVDLVEERDDNGVRQTPPAGGMLSSLRRDGDTWVIKGAFDRPLFGVAHERTFRYTPGQRLVLEDHIRCQRSRTVTAWLHLASDLSGKALKHGWRLPGASIRYESDLPIALSRHRGAKNPMQGWSAPAYHRLEAIDALGATLQGEEIRLRTVIEFGDVPPSRATPRSAGERLVAVLNRVLFASRK